GRLLQTSGGVVGITKFPYDGDELVAEYASNGSTVLRRYVHGAGVDDPLVWYDGAGLTDKLISAVRLPQLPTALARSSTLIAMTNGAFLPLSIWAGLHLPDSSGC